MSVVDIPLTEAERMQARSHAFKMAVLRWSMLGLLLALALILWGSPASDRAAAAEAALRECQRQHAPSRVESAARWLTSPKGGE